MTTTNTGPALTLPLAQPSPLQPAEVLARLRAQAPVAPVTAASGEPAWLVTRYAEARSVLTDPRFRVALPGVPVSDGNGSEGNDSLFQDPPGHTRLRRLVSAAFTPRRIADLRPRVEQIAEELIDQMLARGGPVDVLEALALPLPITVIGELLGVPADQRNQFRAGANALLSLTTPETGDPGAGWQQLCAQVGELIAAKRAHSGQDLLSALIAVRDSQTDQLSDAELVMMAITLITAGYVTTSLAAGVGIILLTGGDHLTRLHDQPDLAATAVEEVLRFQAAAGDVARIAGEDLELSGVGLRAGDKVVVSLTSANRDEQRFVDPDRFDITRADNPHVTFGHGIHHCLGASLARVELQVILTRLAARLPDLALAVQPDELAWQRSELFGDQWPEALPVSW